MKELSIKEIFSFDEVLHKQKISKEKNKKLVVVLISVLIIAISVFAFIKIINNTNPNQMLGSIGLILIALAIISFFVGLTQFLSLVSLITLDKTLLTDRFYAITKDNNFFSLKFKRKELTYRVISDPLIRASLLQNSLDKENKEFIEKINNNIVSKEDLTECLNIINVYSVKETNDEIILNCDYNDLITDTGCKNQQITIYKYFNNWENILKFLQNKITQDKESINNKNGEHKGFINFIIASCKNKINWLFYLFALFGKFGAGIGIVCLSVILYFESKALKYLDKQDISEIKLIKNKIKFDIAFIIINLIIIIVLNII